MQAGHAHGGHRLGPLDQLVEVAAPEVPAALAGKHERLGRLANVAGHVLLQHRQGGLRQRDGTQEVIVAARQAGLPVAVVSNNSAGAVSTYLAAHRLAGHVSFVVGRAYADPVRMKPNPEPILQAVRALGEPPGRCVLVGDSLSDIEGARAAGVRVLGYANRPPKVEAFRAAGADAVITSMGALAQILLDMS